MFQAAHKGMKVDSTGGACLPAVQPSYAVWREPFKLGSPHTMILPPDATLSQIVARMEVLPRDFSKRGVIMINNHEIPREFWHVVRPKNTRAIVTFHMPVQGGGGEGGGGKQVLAIVAALALAVLTAGIATFGIPALGIVGGTFAATAVAAGVSLAGSLLIGALITPPTRKADAQDRDSGAGASLEPASINGNLLEPNSPVPRVIGTRRIFPPFAFEPTVEFEGQDEIVHAISVLAGPHLIEDVRVGGSKIDPEVIDADLRIQTFDGFSDSVRLNYPQRYSRTFPVQLDLSVHGTSPDDLSLFQAPLPVWHGTFTADDPDEVWLHFVMQGLLKQDELSEVLCVPLRIRMRLRGDTAWRYLPELHIADNSQSQRRMQIKIFFGQTFIVQPPTPLASRGWISARKFVPAQNVVPTGTNWNADAYFSSGAGDNIYENGTEATTNVINTTLTPDLAAFYLDHADWPRGIYDIEVIRGAVFKQSDFTSSSYTYDGDILDFYGSTSSNTLPLTRQGVLDRIAFLRAVSVKNVLPINEKNLAMVYVRARNRTVANLSVQASGYVRDLNKDVPDPVNPRHVFYCRFDGADAATEAVDESASAHEMTFLGNAQLDTAIKRFGSASLLLDGTGDYVTAPNSTDFHFGTGDFTIHGVVRPNAITGFHVFVGLDGGGANRGWDLYIDGSGNLIGSVSIDGTNLVNCNAGVVITGVQQHVAFVRKAGVMRAYLNGVGGTPIAEAGSVFASTAALAIGGLSTGALLFDGHIDQLEIVKGVALWSDDFTPPGAGDRWTNMRTTSNPAPHFRDILTGSLNFDPMPASMIDDQSLIDWRDRCETDDLRCDLVAESTTVSELLRLIASCGYARPYQSELWGVIQDYQRNAEAPVQIFTPRNMSGFSWSKAFPRLPTGFRVNYRDDEYEYSGKQLTVYRRGIAETDARLEQITYDGLVRRSDIISRAKYDLLQSELRSVIYTFTAPIESIVCRRGSLVAVNTDVLQKHYGFARVVDIELNADDEVTAIKLDSTVQVFNEIDLLSVTDMLQVADMLRVGLVSAIALRDASGAIDIHTIDASVVTGETDLIVFDPPIDTDQIKVDNLISVGLLGKEYKRLLVNEIIPLENLAARLTLVDEAPELFPA